MRVVETRLIVSLHCCIVLQEGGSFQQCDYL